MTNKQIQKAGDESTNIQVQQVNITQGLSVSEVRTLALDVFKANFLELSGQAADLARARAEQLTEKFLEELQTQHQQALNQAKDPDFQYALYMAQREYARTGDKELGDLLIDLLVDRTKHENRSIIQIVLNESLTIAPKLTADQLASLSVVFIFRYTINHGVNSLEGLNAYLNRYVKPFVDLLSKKAACFQHLEYSGCGSISLGSLSLAEVFRKNYPGLFSKGFTQDSLQKHGITVPLDSPIFMQSLHNPDQIQVNAMNKEVLRYEAARLGLPTADVDKLESLSAQSLMNHQEIKDYLVKAQPHMSTVIDVWEGSLMKNLSLTSVGIAIGHANVKKTLGEFTDLSIWIN
jgi:hypothetical protein